MKRGYEWECRKKNVYIVRVSVTGRERRIVYPGEGLIMSGVD